MRNEQDHHPATELAPELLQAFTTVFLNRDDCYPIQLDIGSYKTLYQPLNPYLLKAHFKGVVTLGAYALNAGSEAKWLCVDADQEDTFQRLISLAQDLTRKGISTYLERSRRGGHLWFFTPRMSGKNIRQFGKQLLQQHHVDNSLEIYPKQDRLTTGVGSFVRLPFGVHRRSQQRYSFITPDGEPLAPTIREQIALLSHPQGVPQSFIDRLLANLSDTSPISPSAAPRFEKETPKSGNTLSETIKASISVFDFVRQFVQLDEQGKGLCPFHDDHHPSFQVSQDGNFWHCYAGCKGSTVIDFWMQWRVKHGQDGSFTETIKELRKMVL